MNSRPDPDYSMSFDHDNSPWGYPFFDNHINCLYIMLAVVNSISLFIIFHNNFHYNPHCTSVIFADNSNQYKRIYIYIYIYNYIHAVIAWLCTWLRVAQLRKCMIGWNVALNFFMNSARELSWYRPQCLHLLPSLQFHVRYTRRRQIPLDECTIYSVAT